MDWRDTKRPSKPVLRVAQNWRNTMRKETPKPFDIKDHELDLTKLVQSEISKVKPGLKGELLAAVRSEAQKLKPKDGKDANQWHILSSVDNEIGKDNDLAFIDGDVYQKESGEWVFKVSVKPKRQNTLVTGGVSETFVNQAIQNAIDDIDVGSPSSEVIVTTSNNYIVTNETHVHFSISSEKTCTLPTTNDKTVTIKNSKQSTANIILSASGSTLDGEADWTILPGVAYEITPIGATAYDIN